MTFFHIEYESKFKNKSEYIILLNNSVNGENIKL